MPCDYVHERYCIQHMEMDHTYEIPEDLTDNMDDITFDDLNNKFTTVNQSC